MRCFLKPSGGDPDRELLSKGEMTLSFPQISLTTVARVARVTSSEVIRDKRSPPGIQEDNTPLSFYTNCRITPQQD